MLKTIVIGDIHGQNEWAEIVNQDCDRVIFLGDYFDSFDVSALDQLHNFKNICNFARTSSREVIMLVGNHDHHYLPGIESQSSGFQPVHCHDFQKELTDNKDLLQMCFVDEHNRVFSHAGLTETFLYDNSIVCDISVLQQKVNDLFVYQPRKFNFSDKDWSGHGESRHQSCIWVRPNSLINDKIDQVQIVGHTLVESINLTLGVETGVYFIDTLQTSKEYLILQNDKIEVSKL